MTEWTIRNSDSGSVQMTGITAETAEDAEEVFYNLTGWDPEDPDYAVYASESGWND